MSGASERTLHIRAIFYRGGRKARSAAKRLRAMGIEPGHQVETCQLVLQTGGSIPGDVFDSWPELYFASISHRPVSDGTIIYELSIDWWKT